MAKKRDTATTVVDESAQVDEQINTSAEAPVDETVATETETVEPQQDTGSGEESNPETDSENTGEATPEPEQDETPQDQEDQDQEEDADSYTGEIPAVEGWGDVKNVIALDTSIGNKIEILSRCGYKPVELFVSFYIDYANTMSPNVNEQDGARFNTRLYNNIMTVLKEADDAVFKTKFDLINLIFKDGAKDAFNEFRLCRFSDIQKVSEKQLSTYHRLVILIYSLADATTRATNKKPLVGFSGSNTELTDDMVSRIKRYYKL